MGHFHGSAVRSPQPSRWFRTNAYGRPFAGLKVGFALKAAATLFFLLTGLGGMGRPAHAEIAARQGRALIGFSDATMAAFRERMKADRDVDAAWEDNRAFADKVLEQPVGRMELDPRRLNPAVDGLILAWRMTGDRRYADRIHELLLRLVKRSSWVTDTVLLKRDPPWHSDLGMGFYGQIFGRAYSSIRDILSPAEREALVRGYVDGVVEPVMGDWIDGRTRIHTLDTMGHNWWAHIVFGMGVGLVAILPDEPRARGWLQRLDEAGTEWWSYGGNDLETKIATFDRDGGYSESVNYANLALNSYLEFRQAWLEGVVQPPARAPLLPKALDFFIHNAYPATRSVSVDFGDGSLGASGAETLATAYAMGDARPDYLWYINLFNRDDQGNDLHRVPHVLVKVPLPSERGGEGSLPDLPLDAWYRGIGWVTLRSSWQKDATLLAIRSGFTWNHNHADAGSFLLFDQGQPLLIDSGNSSYAAPEYDGYYRQSEAHNVVTFDGKAEPAEDTYLGSHLDGSIPIAVSGSGIHYVLADATGPTSANFARNFRHILWIDDVILIVDDLKAHQVGQFEWLVHPAGTAKLADGALHVDANGAQVDVRPLFPRPFPVGGLGTDYPEDMRLVTRQGVADHDPTTSTTYYAFTPADKSERETFMTAIVPKRAAKVRVERMQTLDSIGVRLIDGSKVTEVYLNLKADGRVRHRNAISNLGGWETDAYLLAVTREDGAAAPSRMFVADGSFMRRDGRVTLDSLSKRFIIADLSSTPRLWVGGQLNSEFDMRLPGAGASVEINGKAQPAARDGDLVRIHCCDTVLGQ